MAAIIKVHLSPKFFWIGLKVLVPTTAPTLPMAADIPYAVPLIGVANDSEEVNPILLPGPKFPQLIINP